jgi:hypothetical protein
MERLQLMMPNTWTGLVTRFFKRNGGLRRLQGELAVYYWPRIAGTELGRKVTALRWRDGQLQLQTENPALAHQLTLLVPEILERYRQLFRTDVVKGIKVRIGAVPAPAPLETAVPEPVLEAGEEENITACAARVGDPELAERLTALMRRDYVNRRKLAAGGSAGECFACHVVITGGFDYCFSCERQLELENAELMSYLAKASRPLDTAKLPEDLAERHTALTKLVQQGSKTRRR